MIDSGSKKIYLAAGIITAIIFISGIFIGQLVNEDNVESLKKEVIKLEEDIREERLNLELIKEAPSGKKCELLELKMEDLIKRIGEFQNKADYYEQHKKLNDPEYQQVKKRYMRLLIRHWLLFSDLKKECRKTATTIFYFYTKPCEECIDQGVVLTNLKKKHEEELAIYPFDIHLNVSSLEMLTKAYGIKEYPSLVINEEHIYQGFTSKEKLENILKNKTDLYG